jgi:hypothetical protein
LARWSSGWGGSQLVAAVRRVGLVAAPTPMSQRGRRPALDSVVAVRVEGGLVTGLYSVRNPEKLSHVERETALGR